MLIHPWDAATADDWRAVLADHDFGNLIAAGRDREFPVIVPTHFVLDGDEVLLHLARPNPIWPALAENPRAVLVLTTDWVYIESAWNTQPGGDPTHGVPTSYYTSVQLHGDVEVIDDTELLADLLTRKLAHFEPADSTREPVSTAHEGDRRLLRGIRGLRLRITEVRAKQKYGGNKDPEHRRSIADALEERGGPGDSSAAGQLRRRLG